jgi:hypothetical protein
VSAHPERPLEVSRDGEIDWALYLHLSPSIQREIPLSPSISADPERRLEMCRDHRRDGGIEWADGFGPAREKLWRGTELISEASKARALDVGSLVTNEISSNSSSIKRSESEESLGGMARIAAEALSSCLET